jgi:RecA-family ATPase
MFRTPGRANSKYADGRRCEIVRADGPRYSIDQLRVFAIPGDSSNDAKADIGDANGGELSERFSRLLAKHRLIQRTWRGERPELNDQTGSGYDIAMAHLLAVFRFTAPEIAAILRQMPSGKGAEATRQYLETTIGKAMARICERQDNGEQEQPFEDINEGSSEPDFVTLDTVEREEVEWLWDKKIPKARLTTIAGDMGVGKSMLTCGIVKAITRGEPLPGDTRALPASNVVMLSAEDNYGDTVRPRLEDMGADLTKVYVPNPKRGLVPGQIAINRLERIIVAAQPVLVVLDPIISFSAGKDTDKAPQVRAMLAPFMMLAEKHKLACLIVAHLNKKSGDRAIYRINGSVDFVAAARSVFAVAADKEDSSKRIMAHAKSNLAKQQPSLTFYIDDDSKFRWGEEVSMTADEILQHEQTSSRDKEKQDKAEAFLREFLKDGPRLQSEILSQAKAAGVSQRTLYRAKEALDVQAKKIGFTGQWYWRLREHCH